MWSSTFFSRVLIRAAWFSNISPSHTFTVPEIIYDPYLIFSLLRPSDQSWSRIPVILKLKLFALAQVLSAVAATRSGFCAPFLIVRMIFLLWNIPVVGSHSNNRE